MKKFLIIFLILLMTSPVYAKRWFQTHSTWYEPVPASPDITANSANYVADVKTNSSSIFTFPGDNPGYEYGVPIYQAVGGETVIVVELRSNCATSGAAGCSAIDQAAWDNDWNDVPIPTGTIPAGNANYCAGNYRDGHLAIISADGNTAWEFFGMRHCDGSSPADSSNTSDGTWSAKTVIKWDLTGDGINYPEGGFGDVRVASVPLLHGLVTYDEVVANEIDHALAFCYASLKSTGEQGVYPHDGVVSGANTRTWPLKAGMRLWLDVDDNYCPNLSLNLLNTRVCEAMRTYGMIMVENPGDGNNCIYMESLINKTDSWTGDYQYGTLSGLNISDFEVIDPLEPPFSNTAPVFSISQPDGVDDAIASNASYSITYSLLDGEDTVTFPAKYHTVSGSCLASGTAITGPCANAPEGTDVTCTWDTAGVAAGDYYVCGTVTDGSLSDTAVSPGVLTIEEPPLQPGGFNASGNFGFNN